MAEQERAFKGVWIPADIWLNGKLTIHEKFILAEIDSFCSHYESCYASNEHFAKFIGLSTRRVKDIIKGLEDKGFIEREIIYKEHSKEVAKRLLRLHHPSCGILHEGGAESCPTPSAESCPENNTSMNNTKEGIYMGAKPHRKRKVFTPPALEEVRAYILEKRLNVDAQKFFDYYEAGDWHDAKGKAVKNWKQKCLTWDRHDSSGKTEVKAKPIGNGVYKVSSFSGGEDVWKPTKIIR
jgi:DNA-binding Lrp family transcriptional regulator